MGFDKQESLSFTKYLPSLSFLADRKSTPTASAKSPKADEDDLDPRSPLHGQETSKSAFQSEAPEEAFDAADDLEKGLGTSMDSASSLRHPLDRTEEMQRYFAISSETSEEVLLMNDCHVVLLWALPTYANGTTGLRRVDFFTGAPDSPRKSQAGPASPVSTCSAGRKPDFVMTRADVTGDWSLIQTRCECCGKRPRRVTCAHLGKGQQIARILHTQKKVGKASVHNLDAWMPPLLSDSSSAIWCPAYLGYDLGSTRPPAFPRRTPTSKGMLSPGCSPRKTPSKRGQARGSDDAFGMDATITGSPTASWSSRSLFGLADPTDDLVCLKTKLPKWDKEVECLVLNFNNVKNLQTSARNFMLMGRKDDSEDSGSDDQSPRVGEQSPTRPKCGANIILQHAKVGARTFSLDFMHPLGVIQAFALALSSLDWE